MDTPQSELNSQSGAEEPGSPDAPHNPASEEAASPGPEPTAQPPAPEDTYAVMLQPMGPLVPGQIVRGSAGDVDDMLLADLARAATPAEVERAGKFIFALPEA